MKLIVLWLLSCLMTASAFAAGPETLQVSYLGPEGTYTEEAAQFWFGEEKTLNPKETVNDAVRDVLAGNADYAVIAQENTLGGSVADSLDALIAAKDTYVVGEVVLPICHTLLGVPGATMGDIRTVCSHTQALTQSAEWLSEHLPAAETVEMSSTAAAASLVAQKGDKTVAAIAAPGAAPLYGLEVLCENVQISDTNRTRFYVLSSQMNKAEEQKRAVFVVTCEGRQIADILFEIRDVGLETVLIHDRPERSQLGKYHYVIEVEDQAGIGEARIERVSALEGVRFAGCFNVKVKNSR